MGSAKKNREEKPNKKEKPPPDESSDESSDEEEEEEEIEPEHVRRKRERGRNAFLNLLRRFMTLIPLAVVLSRQPFMVKPRAPGVNSAKMKPLDIAISGAVHFAAKSPTFMRKPELHVYLNATGRVLLTPGEYITAQQSKRAMPAEQTIQGAYKKTAKAFGRLVDKDTQLKEIATAPQPNLALIGSALLVVATLLCPFAGGLFEYLIVVGWCAPCRSMCERAFRALTVKFRACHCLFCGSVLVMQAGRQLGMEAQPELYVAGGVAVLAIGAMEAMGTKKPVTKVKRR